MHVNPFLYLAILIWALNGSLTKCGSLLNCIIYNGHSLNSKAVLLIQNGDDGLNIILVRGLH